MVVKLTCGVFIAGAVVQDLKTRKIKNIYNVTGCLVGIFLQMTAGDGLMAALKGMLAGFMTGFFMYLFGAVKAGDAKTMCAMGTFLGVGKGMKVYILSLLIGGILAFFVILIWKDGKERLRNLRNYLEIIWLTKRYRRYQPEDTVNFPYTINLGLGYLVSCFLKVL